MKLVTFDREFNLMGFHGEVDENYKITNENITWGMMNSKYLADYPYIVVEDDRNISNITKEEILDFQFKKQFERLSEECQKAINKGFHSKVKDAFYSFTQIDQGNMTQQLLLLGVVGDKNATVVWNTEDKGLVTLTQDEFIQLCLDGEKHKREYIAKYWTVKQVLSKTATDFWAISNIGSLEGEYNHIKGVSELPKEDVVPPVIDEVEEPTVTIPEEIVQPEEPVEAPVVDSEIIEEEIAEEPEEEIVTEMPYDELLK